LYLRLIRQLDSEISTAIKSGAPIDIGVPAKNMSLLSSSSLDVSTQGAFVELLLQDFITVLSRENLPLFDNHEYMQLTELKFLLKNIRAITEIQLFQSFSRSDTLTYTPSLGVDPSRDVKRTSTDRLILAQRRAKLDGIIKELNRYVSNRLALAIIPPAEVKAVSISTTEISPPEAESAGIVLMKTAPEVAKLPRILELCNRYQFSDSEKEIFHLMVVVQGSSNCHVLNVLVEEDYLRRIGMYMSVCTYVYMYIFIYAYIYVFIFMFRFL
jgi:hypothetical protein